MTEKTGQQLILNFPAHPEYSFSNFVVSEGSRIAFEAAKELSGKKPFFFQALYIFGQKNLGKTHLLLSIGNHAAEIGMQTVFIQGQEFSKKMNLADDPKKILEHFTCADFFLIDNIECLASSKRAQEKLYHIYNEIRGNGGKLVFTANLPPEKIPSMEDYLTSRFQWGLVTEIKAIDDPTTAKIILKLANDINLKFPEPIIQFLLSRVPRDFVSIQNAVKTINRESLINKKKVTLPLVKAALNLD